MRWKTTAAILLVAMAASAARGTQACQDADGDGYFDEASCGTPRDCNDASPTIHPGAPEVCDGYDNDCDGSQDNDPACDTTCSEPDALGDLLLLSGDYPREVDLVWTGSEYAVIWTIWDAELDLAHLFFRRIDNAGSPIGSDVLVATGWDVDEPSLVWTGTEYGVAWSHSIDAEPNRIYLARLDTTGVKIGSDVQLTEADESHRPSLVWTGSEFGVAWQRSEGLGDLDIYFARLDASGNKIGSDTVVADTTGATFSPDLEWTGSEYGIVWSSGSGIDFARIDVSGNKVGEAHVTAGTSLEHPRLVWTGSEYGVAWRDWIATIWFSRFDASGNKIGSDVPIAVAGWEVSLAWTGSEYGVLWQGRDSNQQWPAYLSRVDGVGNAIGSEVRLTELSYRGLRGAWTGSGYGLVGIHEFTRFGCDCTDHDLDGFTECQDCDDQNPSVYPGAPEQCDGLNNDCRDPQWPDPPDYEDTDADGFTPCDGDCDDAAANVFPGSPQLCDGVNNDCDEPTWPAVPEDETDADGDSLSECQGDCDDTNPNVNPQAPELCNQIDDNCNQLVDEDALGVDTDHDGMRNACDNCNLDWNVSQSDIDANGVGDRCDLTDGLIYTWFDEPSHLSWQDEINFTSWNSYRGDLDLLLSDGALNYTQDPSRVPLASRSCDLADTWLSDADPPPGTAVFFLTTGNELESGLESSLGVDGYGVERVNRFPCP